MEDWEEETLRSVAKKLLAMGSWDDEDEDENDVRESWEDDNEPVVPAPKPKISKNVPLDHGGAQQDHHERVVEEADFRSEINLVGEKSEEKTLNNFIPKSESDFSEYAQLISQKLHLYQNSFHYIELLKAVMKFSITALKAEDAKEIASSVATIANEKLKSEKESNVSKIKTGAKKKQLNVDKANEDVIVDTYDSYNDYAFK